MIILHSIIVHKKNWLKLTPLANECHGFGIIVCFDICDAESNPSQS